MYYEKGKKKRGMLTLSPPELAIATAALAGSASYLSQWSNPMFSQLFGIADHVQRLGYNGLKVVNLVARRAADASGSFYHNVDETLRMTDWLIKELFADKQGRFNFGFNPSRAQEEQYLLYITTTEITATEFAASVEKLTSITADEKTALLLIVDTVKNITRLVHGMAVYNFELVRALMTFHDQAHGREHIEYQRIEEFLTGDNMYTSDLAATMMQAFVRAIQAFRNADRAVGQILTQSTNPEVTALIPKIARFEQRVFTIAHVHSSVPYVAWQIFNKHPGMSIAGVWLIIYAAAWGITLTGVQLPVLSSLSGAVALLVRSLGY
jgi:hypothetical protein